MKIAVICPIYNRFPEIIPSMINQTYENWELFLIHDGPNNTGIRDLIDKIGDKRIKFLETEMNRGIWGHPIRRDALRNINNLCPECEYILITNDDNYHAKIYFEEMLKGFSNSNIKAVYCSQFVHSYESPQKEGDYRYGVIDTRLELGYIDCACVMMTKDTAIESGWEDISHSSDWTYFERIIKKYGEESFNRVLGCLLVHA